MKNQNNNKLRRKVRVRLKIRNGEERIRLSVFRSNKHMYAQLIDDAKRETLIGVSEKDLKKLGTKTENAKELGLLLANKAKVKKITKIVFDRGSYAYHGRVRQVAEGLREGGIEL